MSIAQVTNLTVRYGTKTAVSNLSVTVPEGCIGLLGPNGAGKTTLIKALLGFVEPHSGTGSVLGFDIVSQPLDIRMNVGLMPELDCHIPGMSAVEYVAYAGELCGMPREHAMRRAHEVLDYCYLGEARYRNLETYSTGMKQRAKLAQALVHGPKLLFLDEPTNGMDPAGRDEMLFLIKDVSHQKGVNVIVSSHLLPDIEKTCDYVIVMQSGEVKTQDTVVAIREVSATQWDVELREPVTQFTTEIEKSGGKVLHQLSAHYRIEFPIITQNLPQLIFNAAADCGAQVRSFLPAQRSLEDAFLEALS